MIKNFKAAEQFEDADNCYFRYRDWKRANRPFGFGKISDYIAWLSCGYGIKPDYTVGLGAMVILLFGIIYWIGRAAPETAYEDITVRYVGTSLSKLSVSIYFSALAFLTPHASIELRPSRYWKHIILIEHILGLMLMALFLVTLDRILVRG